MGGVQRVGNLNRQFHTFIERNRSVADPLLESLALEQFHNKEWVSLMPASIVNRTNVRMVERRGSARLPFKALQGIRTLGLRFRQKLECNQPSQSRIFCFVHDSHTT